MTRRSARAGREPSRLAPAARAAFWTAAVLGTLHAAWSAYWAAGGRVLLETVGQWAVEAADAQPGFAFRVLTVVALAKLAGAWIPLLAETGRIPGRRFWRFLAWIGGPALILYGGADVVVGSAVLLGWLDAEVTDRQALIGHAFIWGPHFALWGVALTVGLLLTRAHRMGPRQ